MHIAEGFLPPLHAAAWTLASAPFVVHGARAVVRQVRDHPQDRLLLGAAGAFTFVLSAIKLPSVTGSSSHPTGTGLGAVLFRPPVMALLGTLVLVFQALLLAHGGLTTLGANAFSFAVVGPWAGWLAFAAARRLGGPLPVAVFCAAAVADLATYGTTSLQLALAFPDPVTGVAGALATFLGVFGLTQVPLAAAEGVLCVLVVRALVDVAPQDLRRLRLLPAAAEAVADPAPAGESGAS